MMVQQPEFVTGSYCFMIASSAINPRTAQVLCVPTAPSLFLQPSRTLGAPHSLHSNLSESLVYLPGLISPCRLAL